MIDPEDRSGVPSEPMAVVEHRDELARDLAASRERYGHALDAEYDDDIRARLRRIEERVQGIDGDVRTIHGLILAQRAVLDRITGILDALERSPWGRVLARKIGGP